MTKEQQKAAADRIMAKLGPLEGQELETYNLLVKKPEDYVPPSDHRVCGKCGQIFRDTVNAKGEVQVTMLEKFTDHQAEHNPSPALWAEAHKRIQSLKQSQ